MSASVLAVALVLGEYTISSLLSFNTLQVVIYLLGKRDPFIAVAVSFAALFFAFVLLFVITRFAPGRPPGRSAPPRSPPHDRHEPAFRPRTATASRVTFEELHRWYGPVHALDGLSIDIAPGELIALLGPSGCGKTTALRALGGLDEVDQGRILVDGKDMTHAPTNKRNMGIVFQAYSLFPNIPRATTSATACACAAWTGALARRRPRRCSSWSG